MNEVAIMNAQSEQVVSKNCRVKVRIREGNKGIWLCYAGVPPRHGDSTMTLESPLGKALLDKRVGEQVIVKLPLATRTVTIEEVEHRSARSTLPSPTKRERKI